MSTLAQRSAALLARVRLAPKGRGPSSDPTLFDDIVSHLESEAGSTSYEIELPDLHVEIVHTYEPSRSERDERADVVAYLTRAYRKCPRIILDESGSIVAAVAVATMVRELRNLILEGQHEGERLNLPGPNDPTYGLDIAFERGPKG